MFCPSCGKVAAMDGRFCPNCGAPVVATPLPSGAGARQTVSGQSTLSGPSPGGEAAALAPGFLFHARYRIEAALGRGGMGVVYRAADGVTGDVVVLKVIQPALLQSEELTRRFLREGKLARDLRHPNIVSVYDVSVGDGVCYLSMEFLDGQSLRGYLLEHLRARREVPLAAACRIVRGILAGLGAAHEAGVVHRDLKPENVMLLGDPAGDDLRVKLLDFGIARALRGQDSLTVAGAAMGTPIYMAPEQETGAETAGPEADLYSAAVIFYELLLGIPPRGRWELPGKVRPGLPSALDAFFETALQSHPARRFASVAAFAAAMDRAVGRGASPRAVEPPELPRRAAPQQPEPRQQAGSLEPPRLPPADQRRTRPLVDALAPGLRIWTSNRQPWPWSRAQWFVTNAIPCCAWAAWLTLTLRTRRLRYLAPTAVYLFPLLALVVVTEGFEYMSRDPDEVTGFVAVLVGCWIAALIQAALTWPQIAAMNEQAQRAGDSPA